MPLPPPASAAWQRDPWRDPQAWAGTLGYLFAAVFWGLNLPLTGRLLQHFDPFWISPLRYIIAATLLAVLVVASEGGRALASPIPWWRVAVLGLFVSLFLVLFNLGLSLTPTMTAAAVTAGSPVVVAAVLRAMTGAPLEKGFWTATALALAGAGLAIHARMQANAGQLGLKGGEPLLVAAIACWTVYSILAQRWFTAGATQLRRTWLSSLLAIPWLLAFWVLARLTGLAGPPLLTPDAATLGQLVVAAAFCTALATVGWNIGVNRQGMAVGAVWQNMVPVFAVLISLLLFGIVPLPGQVAGGALVLAGVLWMQWRRRRP